jgi:hypothetical protein
MNSERTCVAVEMECHTISRNFIEEWKFSGPYTNLFLPAVRVGK